MQNTFSAIIRLIIHFSLLLFVFLMLPENVKLDENITITNNSKYDNTNSDDETTVFMLSAQSESNNQLGMNEIIYRQDKKSKNLNKNAM